VRVVLGSASQVKQHMQRWNDGMAVDARDALRGAGKVKEGDERRR
jgi:hypothetical protein